MAHGEGAHRLHGPAHMLVEPLDEGPCVMTIAPHQLDGGKALFQRLTYHPRSRLIRAIGSQHFDGQQVALRINEQVPFASPDFFSPRRSPFQDRAPHWLRID